MNVLKITLVLAVLLGIALLSGCQEGYSQENNLNRVEKVAFEPSGTGFWRPSH